MSRFASFSIDEVNKLKEKSKNENTNKATTNWMKVYRSRANSREKPEDIECISPKELDAILSLFFAEIRN